MGVRPDALTIETIVPLTFYEIMKTMKKILQNWTAEHAENAEF
jgi:hypothetical protein